MSEAATSNVFESYTISADHKDLIHDVAYDFYGERMATCSSDQYVKVRLCFCYQSYPSYLTYLFYAIKILIYLHRYCNLINYFFW